MKPSLRRFAAILGCTTIICLGGCREEKTWRDSHFSEKEAVATTDEALIPAALWEQLLIPDGAPVKFEPLKGSQRDAEDIDEATPTPTPSGRLRKPMGPDTRFVPIDVYLRERTKGVLDGKDVKIRIGPGGGEIDLRDFLTNKTGGLYFYVEPSEPELSKLSWRMWFVSESKSRKIGPDTVGAGCDVYMDLTTEFRSVGQRGGFLTSTAQGRHAYALGGSYFLAAKSGEQILLARLRIKDTRFREAQCPPLQRRFSDNP